MVERFYRWVARHSPSREEIANSRWSRLVGRRILESDLWRFTRRSVPRGVGLGILVGIFLMIPGLQIIGAALVSIPFRANFPIAAAMTFLSNPATTPFILVASIWVGNRLGFHADLAAFQALVDRGAGFGEWFGWLFSDAAPALVSGLFLIGAASGLAGYFAAILIWRWRTGRKWRGRAVRGGEPG